MAATSTYQTGSNSGSGPWRGWLLYTSLKEVKWRCVPGRRQKAWRVECQLKEL